VKIKVYGTDGSSSTYDADKVETTGAELWVTKDQGVVVAVYAPGQWINADFVADE
jgi:hypothetical protein